MTAGDAILSVRDLRTYFPAARGPARAVDGIGFDVRRGETVALVGESGCGKSVTVLSLLRLVPPPGRIVGGSVRLEGRELLTLAEGAVRRLRGDRIAMVPQDPTAALNPVLRVGDQIAEALRCHGKATRREATRASVELLERVSVPSPELRARSFPHQLSTGLKQRALLAMALACSPDVLLADEPTTSLDVTVEAQILDLLREIRRDTGMGVLFVTHDLAVVAEIADRVLVMYAGRIVEEGPVRGILDDPLHPYTRALLASIPRGPFRGERLAALGGEPPSPAALPAGCRFHPRCPLAVEECARTEPELVERSAEHRVACPFARHERGGAL